MLALMKMMTLLRSLRSYEGQAKMMMVVAVLFG
jgi:hypothetical protein